MHLGEAKHVMSTHLKNLGEAHLMSTHNICFYGDKNTITKYLSWTIFICMFYFQNRIWHFMKIVSNEDYLHEVSNPIFWLN